MKRIISWLVAVCMILVITGCGNKYSIRYESTDMLIPDSIVYSAEAGETVCIRAYPIMDASLIVSVNGTEISMTHWDSDYWEYSFVMPEGDVTVSFEIDGGM